MRSLATVAFPVRWIQSTRPLGRVFCCGNTRLSRCETQDISATTPLRGRRRSPAASPILDVSDATGRAFRPGFPSMQGIIHPGDCRGYLPSPIVLPMSDEWMTYAEAGKILGIKPESVKRRARAKRWPRITGNDGKARVQIPDMLNPGDGREDDLQDALPTPSAPNPPHDDTRERLASAETEIRLLRERLDDLTADRDALRDALERAASRPPSLWARLFQR